jgi:maleate isomerase
VLALFERLNARGEKRIGLAVPYTGDVTDAIVANFAREGVEIIAERHLGISDNFSFSEVSQAKLAEMVADLAASRPDAIVAFCTNFSVVPMVDALERRHAIPVHDSVAAAVYGALKAAGADVGVIKGYGRMFEPSP